MPSDRTPQDHEAAARVAQEIEAVLEAVLPSLRHVAFQPHGTVAAIVAAALAEAVRDERERILDAPLPICPGCYDIVEAAIRSEAQATPAPEHPEGLHVWNKIGGCSVVGCRIRYDGSYDGSNEGTPPETKER